MVIQSRRLRVPRAPAEALTATLLLALLVASCGGSASNEMPGEPGHLMLIVKASTVLPIKEVSYEIKGRRKLQIKGRIPIDDLTRTISANVRRLPSGNGYELTLSAASTDGDLTCTGKAGFQITPKQTTALAAMLECRSLSGAVAGGTPRGYCPLIKSTTLAPTQTSVGGSVMVAVRAEPGEAAAGAGAMTYAWSGKGGTFQDPAAGSTTFKCEMPGDHVLFIRVASGMCADRDAVTARCVALACGNGTKEAGESCDDGNREDGDGCPGDCVLPGCGNNKIDPGETCEPPGTPECDASCTKIIGCGNGQVEGSEQCDDANRVPGDGCSENCMLEQAICGNGVVEPGEECEPPSAGTCNAVCKTGQAQ